MDYKIGDEVIFYRSSCEKALEVERKGTITKINKKTYKINEKLIRKDLIKSNTQLHNNEDH